MNKGKILWVENDPDFFEVRAKFIEAAGYEVLKASTLEEAEQLLRKTWVHLAILDIRMKDDDDEWDRSGLDWANKQIYGPLPKIILTGFPSPPAMRKALRPGMNKQPLAVDFLDKGIEPEEMIEDLDKAFAQYAQINRNLSIRWASSISFVHLAGLIEPSIDNAGLLDRADELEDLFCCLFYETNQITITRLLLRREESVLLTVHTFSAEGRESQFLVACHRREFSLDDKPEKYEKFVLNIIGEGSVVEFKSTETIHFAVTAYEFTGDDLERVISFREFYHHNSSNMAIAALKHLFDTTLAHWHKQDVLPGQDETVVEFLLEQLKLNDQSQIQQKLRCQIEDISAKALSARLIEPNHPLFGLIDILPQALVAPDLPILSNLRPGRLDGDSILVDRQPDHQWETWLIASSQAGQRLFIDDLVALEVSIKFDLLTGLNLQERIDVEKQLMAPSGLAVKSTVERVEPGSEIQKALQVINYIRERASVLPDYDIKTYHSKLVFCALSRLANYNPNVQYTRHQLMPYLYTLISVDQLTREEAHSFSPEQSLQSPPLFRIDTDRQTVWVEGKSVALTPTEYELLLILYRQANTVRTRQEISQALNMEENETVENKLNTMISRLRKKIEPDSDQPRYILNVRGVGYKLNIDGNPSPD